MRILDENGKSGKVAEATTVTGGECGLCGRSLRCEEVARVVHGRPYCAACVESDAFFQVLARAHGKDVKELGAQVKPEKARNKRLILLIVGLAIIAAQIVYLLFFLPPIPQGRHLAYQGNATEEASGITECIENMWKISIAVQKYHDKTGTYPESLENLVPEYLDEVPVCPLSQMRYNYYNREGGPFWECPTPHEHGAEAIQCDNLGGPPVVHRQPQE